MVKYRRGRERCRAVTSQKSEGAARSREVVAEQSVDVRRVEKRVKVVF